MFNASFTLKSHTGQYSSGHCIYLLNKGMNSGRPKYAPYRNCFFLIPLNPSDKMLYYWLCYGLWYSKAYYPLLRGSVIPFIRLTDAEHCIGEAVIKAQSRFDEFTRFIEFLQVIEEKEALIQGQQKLYNQYRMSGFHNIFRK